MNLLKVIAFIVASTTSLTASANELVPVGPVSNNGGPVTVETRSPLTDWSAQSRVRASRDRSGEGSQQRYRQRAATSMIDIGIGTENAFHAAGVDLNSGWNILISVRGQIDRDDIGGNERWEGPRNRDKRLMLLHVDGRMAVNPQDSSERVPYLDIKIIPISMTAVDTDHSNQTFLGINFAQVAVHRDVRLGRDYRLAVTAVGIDIRHQTEVNANVDFLLAAAINILGARIQDGLANLTLANSGAPAGTLRQGGGGVQINSNELAMSLLFHRPDRACGGRITLGARSWIGMVWARGNDLGATTDDQGYAVASDLDAFAEAAVQVTPFLEVYSRVSIMYMFGRENGVPSAVQTRSIAQFMAGASLQF